MLQHKVQPSGHGGGNADLASINNVLTLGSFRWSVATITTTHSGMQLTDSAICVPSGAGGQGAGIPVPAQEVLTDDGNRGVIERKLRREGTRFTLRAGRRERLG